MSTSIDTMKNFFNVLKLYANDTTANGVAVLDNAVRATTRFAGLQDAINHFVADMANVTATQGVAQSLYQNCGIVLGADYDFTADTGAVSGYNAGMGVVKNAQDIVPEPDVNLSELPLPAAGSTTVHSYTGADGNTFYYTATYPETYLTVRDIATAPINESGIPETALAQSTNLQAGQIYTFNGADYSASGEQIASGIQTMLRGIDNYWLDAGFKLAYDSFGLDFNNKNIDVDFGVNQQSAIETGLSASDVNFDNALPSDNLEMITNSVIYSQIDPNDPNGNTRVPGGSYQSYLDRTIAHELVHALMFASGTIKEGMPQFFTEGVTELVHGSDDFDTNADMIAELSQDSARLTQALALEAGTGTPDAYPAGYMFMRYLCQQSQPVNVEFGSPAAQIFTHTTSQDIISGYKDGDQVNVGTGVQIAGVTVAGDDLFVTSNIGSIIMRDARGKVLNFADGYGNINGRGFVANAAGVIDGRIFGESEVIYGADFVSNEIRAGDGGSKLWGGSYSNDDLHGGAGVDEFITGVGCGHDNIFGANEEDTINLAATTLDQISSVYVAGGGIESDIMMNFTDGSSLTVWSLPGKTLNFKLADGSTYSHNNSTGQWTKSN